MGKLGLPEVKPARMAELVWFDITVGTPAAAKILRAELGKRQLLNALFHYLRRSLKRDPLRVIELPGWSRLEERLARRQFRAAMLLEDILIEDLKMPREEADPLIREVIAEVGAQFIASNVPMPAVDSWREAMPSERTDFLKATTQRFFNARVEKVVTTEEEFGFDITACQFVQLAHRLNRPQLAMHFCVADSRFFARPDAPVEFQRTQTIAEGAPCCDFRFKLHNKDEKD